MPKHKADVYTRTGDGGTTALFGGTRIEKDSPKVEAYGTVDELCAVISVVKTQDINEDVKEILTTIQDYCYNINSEIASDEEGKKQLVKRMSQSDIDFLENLIDHFDSQLPKLTHFIIPTHRPATAFLNLARTVCRRAERRLWALSRAEELNIYIIKYFNRLSDFLFILMRYVGKDDIAPKVIDV